MHSDNVVKILLHHMGHSKTMYIFSWCFMSYIMHWHEHSRHTTRNAVAICCSLLEWCRVVVRMTYHLCNNVTLGDGHAITFPWSPSRCYCISAASFWHFHSACTKQPQGFLESEVLAQHWHWHYGIFSIAIPMLCSHHLEWQGINGLLSPKPLSELMQTYCHLDAWEQILAKLALTKYRWKLQIC